MTEKRNLTVVGENAAEQPLSPSKLVAMLSSQDKATIMSLCMPKGATDAELALYLYRCKEMGFDPLSGELVLQKRINKDGSVKLSFITTRDALLKKAEQNPNYLGISSGVVREGDTFTVDTEKSVVKHSFGAKRGKVLAGWAVAYHKTRLPVIAVVDFAEYAAANSMSPVWQTLPSIMIQKVAEVAALRRQFPILAQGIYTAEEMQADEPVTVTVPRKPEMTVEVETEPAEAEVVEAEAAAMEPAPEPIPEPEPVPEVEPVPKAECSTEAPQDVYKLLALQTGKSGIGTPYAKIACEKNGQRLVLLAKGEEGLAEVAKLRENCLFQVETVEEKGFTLVKRLTVVA